MFGRLGFFHGIVAREIFFPEKLNPGSQMLLVLDLEETSCFVYLSLSFVYVFFVFLVF